MFGKNTHSSFFVADSAPQLPAEKLSEMKTRRKAEFIALRKCGLHMVYHTFDDRDPAAKEKAMQAARKTAAAAAKATGIKLVVLEGFFL